MKLRWNKPAREAFDIAVSYIQKDSYSAALKVVDRMEKKTVRLSEHPLLYSPDKSKIHNDGTYRAFTSDSLRVSYRVFKQSIHILRVRHVKRKPLKY